MRPLTLSKAEQAELRSGRHAGATAPTNRRSDRPGRWGWPGRGGGAAGPISPIPEYRGTTVQVCGLYPFAAGTGTPLVGVPLGKHLMNGQTMCADPISWFERRLVDTPSAFVLGRPGKGKSSLVRRIVVGLVHAGVVPMIMADLKPDYVDLIGAMGGDVIRVGRGVGSINPLDPGPVRGLLEQMSPRARERATADLRARRLAILCSLIELVRHTAITAREQNILNVAMRLLDDQVTGRELLVGDVLTMIRAQPAELRYVALDRGSEDKYQQETEGLEEGLMALGEDGPFGAVFCRPTSQPVRLGVPTCFDVSAVTDDDTLLQAAAQAVCWSYGSSAVAAAQHGADDGIGAQVIHFLVMDELWRMLRAWEGMVDLCDAITRLNRQMGIGQVMITHTMADLKLSREELTQRAWGFVERSSMVFLGGLADKEMGNLREVFDLSEREVALIASWSVQASIDPRTNTASAPPGQGCFLLKTGKAPGTPFQVHLTTTERAVNDTNKRWATLAHTPTTRGAR